jgi:hypothetical protein
VSLKFRHLEAAMRLRSPCAMMVRMAERRRKRPRDPLALAKMIGDIATGQTSDTEPDMRNQAAVELGRLGGKRGGRARANKMTPERRKEIAQNAAQKRWSR